MGPGVRRASVARLLCRCGVTASLRSRVADTRLDFVTGFYYFHHCEFRVNLRSKRGLPLTNQILGWVALGKILPPLTVGHATHASSSTSWIFAFDSICSIVPVRIPGHIPHPALEDPLVLPRVLGLFRDTFRQCRGAVFSFVFGAAGCVGRSGGCHMTLCLSNRQTDGCTGRRKGRDEWGSDGWGDEGDSGGQVPAQGGRSADCVFLLVFRPGRVLWDWECGFDFVSWLLPAGAYSLTPVGLISGHSTWIQSID